MTILTIAASAPFLDSLADGLIAEAGGDPMRLAAMTVLLPTRRACLAMRESFLRLSEGTALLLPRMVPLGDIDADELEFLDTVGTLDLPPAIAGMRRQLLLAQTIIARDGLAPDQAASLAIELGKLLDQMATERVDFSGLATLVPDDYAEHWQRVLRFLAILGDHWPAILAEQGAVDPAERRNLTLDAQARQWQEQPPADPIIAAGSTGSIPATAALLTIIAGLPAGRVVLPGLDRTLDDESWDAIEPSHPQYGMKQLLAQLGVARAGVADWASPHVADGDAVRTDLLRAALNPLPMALPDPEAAARALTGITRLDCLNPQQEAGAVALLLRETLERPGATAALVTPDRDLARRVAAELGRFGIAIDDSAGTPLDRTAPGTYLRLLLTLVAEDAAPGALLAVLQHPFTSGGQSPAFFRGTVRLFERAVLRGPRPDGGLAGLAAAIPAKLRPNLIGWTEQLVETLAPLAAIMNEKDASLAELVRTHVAVAEALAGTEKQPGAERLWAAEAGEAAADFIADLVEAAASFPALEGKRYPALFETLIAGRVVRPRYGKHPRLAIWGPLEARLQRADRLILSGLNEGTWPADPASDPWLSRPMRAKLGLPPPERRIGQSAHDFVQAFASPELILTRAQRVEGAPTVPSRWLQRLDTMLRALGLDHALDAGEPWLAWQHALDRPDKVQPTRPPAPRPPVAARPRKLSVTEIETWMRDPYALYCRHVLALRALEPIDADPGAADRGAFIHQALDRFVRAFPDTIPDDALDRLLAFGEEAFGATLDNDSVRTFWWPRFERVARWLVEEERRRRPDIDRILTEAMGTMILHGPAGDFQLTGKADRIELRRDGGIELIDYKTGTLPAPRDIVDGIAAQLPLEAVMALAQGFAGLHATRIDGLSHWRLSGGDPAGEVKPIADAAERIDAARDGLQGLILLFDDPDTPYHARPHPARALRFNDYAHLARLKEWAAEDGE